MGYCDLEGWISSIALLRFWLDWGNGEEDNREIVSNNKTDGWGCYRGHGDQFEK